jgi:hypothetical protein
MKQDVLNKINALGIRAKVMGRKDAKLNLSSSHSTVLNQTIKTQEQADLFMKRLRALE